MTQKNSGLVVELVTNNGTGPFTFGPYEDIVEAESKITSEIKRFHISEVRNISVYDVENGAIQSRVGEFNMEGKFMCI